jgi:hypothetical protein
MADIPRIESEDTSGPLVQLPLPEADTGENNVHLLGGSGSDVNNSVIRP